MLVQQSIRLRWRKSTLHKWPGDVQTKRNPSKTTPPHYVQHHHQILVYSVFMLHKSHYLITGPAQSQLVLKGDRHPNETSSQRAKHTDDLISCDSNWFCHGLCIARLHPQQRCNELCHHKDGRHGDSERLHRPWRSRRRWRLVTHTGTLAGAASLVLRCRRAICRDNQSSHGTRGRRCGSIHLLPGGERGLERSRGGGGCLVHRFRPSLACGRGRVHPEVLGILGSSICASMRPCQVPLCPPVSG